MLKRIHCDKFADFISEKTITFYEGLNVVLGQDDKVNSIGKSTLLLIVDFCFGGAAYSKKNSDIYKNVGDHSIDFTFRFDEKEYHFSRDVSDPSKYWECDQLFNRIGDPKRIGNLHAFLKVHCSLNDVLSSFRFIVSRFMRINGKDNYNVSLPLKAGNFSEKESDGITVLEDLFGMAANLEIIKQQIKDIKDKIKQFKSARDGDFVFVSFNNEKGYKDAKNKLENLLLKLEDLKNQITNDEYGETGEISDEVLEAKSKLSYEIRKRGYLKSKLKKLSCVGSFSMTEKDLESLRHLFPGVSMKPLSEIVAFQNDLKRNVENEIELQRTELIASISKSDKEIEVLKKTLIDLNVEPKTSRALLEECLGLEKEADALEKQISLYEKWKNLKKSEKEKKQELIAKEANSLCIIQQSLNKRMEEINNLLYATKRMPPTIEIKDGNKYRFMTQNDSGTGTMYKSLLVFDLSVLELTSLPVLIHDSLLFSDIWSEPMSVLLKIYKRQTKQVFIAFDGLSLFDNETRTLVLDASRIVLGNGAKSLFGRSWALKND